MLATKFFIPRCRPGAVVRTRLLERLDRGLVSKLTLISAPPGFGKTTLLAEWLATLNPEERSVAWLSLDSSDDRPAAFWTHVITALQTAQPEVGKEALAMLQSAPMPPMEAVFRLVLNDIAALPRDLVLVLDDYHFIETAEIHEGVTFLLDHVPPQLHLIIASRADPMLPLPRMRARGELREVRAADLRFTPDEAAAFLNGAMGLDLSSLHVAELESQTEGWIAALQLAALSMQGHDDVAGFIGAFTGNDRYIVDYLVDEVLQRQSEEVRDFLLQTSILDRLSGSLCDAITGLGNGRSVLEKLERGNLFVIPLDRSRHWFRYHHLFAEVLRAHLLDRHPERLAELHVRASDWYEANGERAEAIAHAMAGHDFARAAGLVELAVPALRRSRQEAVLLGWLKALPDETVRDRPVLGVSYAGALLACGETGGVESRLRDAERWLRNGVTMAETQEPAQAAPGQMVVMHDDVFPASIALYRAGLALALGDLSEAVDYARQVLCLAAEDDHFRRGAASGILGLAYWTTGDLETAHRMYAEGMAHLHMAGNIADAVGGAIALADIRVTQGRLREAMGIYEQALRLARERKPEPGAPDEYLLDQYCRGGEGQGEMVVRGTADLYVVMSVLHREWDDLESATQLLMRSQELAGCCKRGEGSAEAVE